MLCFKRFLKVEAVRNRKVFFLYFSTSHLYIFLSSFTFLVIAVQKQSRRSEAELNARLYQSSLCDTHSFFFNFTEKADRVGHVTVTTYTFLFLFNWFWSRRQRVGLLSQSLLLTRNFSYILGKFKNILDNLPPYIVSFYVHPLSLPPKLCQDSAMTNNCVM